MRQYPLQQERQAGRDFLKVFAKMAIDLTGAMQGRQHVDKAKELDLDRFLAHGPVHEAIVPPGRAQRPWSATANIRKNGPSHGMRQGFERVIGLGGRHQMVLFVPGWPAAACEECGGAWNRSLFRRVLACAYDRLLSSLKLPIWPHGVFMSTEVVGIGRFQVVSTLGTGAHSTILHIRRQRDGKQYALKVVPLGNVQDRKFQDQARHEFKVAQMLDHPNLIKVYAPQTARDWLFPSPTCIC